MITYDGNITLWNEVHMRTLRYEGSDATGYLFWFEYRNNGNVEVRDYNNDHWRRLDDPRYPTLDSIKKHFLSSHNFILKMDQDVLYKDDLGVPKLELESLEPVFTKAPQKVKCDCPWSVVWKDGCQRKDIHV